jgi:hypothetical protein
MTVILILKSMRRSNSINIIFLLLKIKMRFFISKTIYKVIYSLYKSIDVHTNNPNYYTYLMSLLDQNEI